MTRRGTEQQKGRGLWKQRDSKRSATKVKGNACYATGHNVVGMWCILTIFLAKTQ